MLEVRQNEQGSSAEVKLENSDDEGCVVLEPTEEELFYVALGDEQVKRNIPFINEVLRQLATISIALMGGSIAFLNDSVINKHFKTVAIVVFLAALGFSLLGIVPYLDTIERGNAKQIKQSIIQAIECKKLLLHCAAAALFFGLFLCFLGLLFK